MDHARCVDLGIVIVERKVEVCRNACVRFTVRRSRAKGKANPPALLNFPHSAGRDGQVQDPVQSQEDGNDLSLLGHHPIWKRKKRGRRGGIKKNRW